LNPCSLLETRWWFFCVADERVSADLKKNIMQARLEKKLTQAQLAQVLIGLRLSSVMC
jgi:hypothetical protein